MGPRFPNVVYDKDLRDAAKQIAKDCDFKFVKEGVLTAQIGPAFETVAECRMLRLMGADAAGVYPSVICVIKLMMPHTTRVYGPMSDGC